jgi:hypothetical protein
MNRAGTIFRTIFLTIALALLVGPAAAAAQQSTPSIEDPLSKLNTSAPSASELSQGLRPQTPNPFQQPGSGVRKGSNDGARADSWMLQIDRKWTSASAVYAFSAPPGFYSSGRDQSDSNDWDSFVTSEITGYVNRSNTTYLRLSSDLETYGQKREAGDVGGPGGQNLTIQWEAAHLVSSKFGALEIAAGRFQQQLVSNFASPNSPLTDVWAGHAAASAGFETTFTLPDKNIVFSMHGGTLGPGLGKAHLATFELSWTW